MAALIEDQILLPQPLLQESSYITPLFHQQFFCPSARRYDISAHTKNIFFKLPSASPKKDQNISASPVWCVSEMSLLSSAGDIPTNSFHVVPGGGSGGGDETVAAISMTVHMLILPSEAKFSIAGSMSCIIYPCLWHMCLAPLCLGTFHTRARKIQGSWNRHHQALAIMFFLYFLICPV